MINFTTGPARSFPLLRKARMRVRFIWNAAKDLSTGFKASGVKVKGSA